MRCNSKNRRNVYKGQVNEVQELTCVADEGGFYLSFRGVQTARLVWDMTNNQLEAALEAALEAPPVIEDGAHPDGHVDRVHRPHRGRAVAAVFFVWGHGHAGDGAVRMHE